MKSLPYAQVFEDARLRLDVSVSTGLTWGQWCEAYRAAEAEWLAARLPGAERDERARAELAWLLSSTTPADGDVIVLPADCERVLAVSAVFSAGGSDRRLPVSPRSRDFLGVGLTDPWNFPQSTNAQYVEGGLSGESRRVEVYADQAPKAVVVEYQRGTAEPEFESETPPPYPRSVQQQIHEITLRKLSGVAQDAFRYQAQTQVETPMATQ